MKSERFFFRLSNVKRGSFLHACIRQKVCKETQRVLHVYSQPWNLLQVATTICISASLFFYWKLSVVSLSNLGTYISLHREQASRAIPIKKRLDFLKTFAGVIIKKKVSPVKLNFVIFDGIFLPPQIQHLISATLYGHYHLGRWGWPSYSKIILFQVNDSQKRFLLALITTVMCKNYKYHYRFVIENNGLSSATDYMCTFVFRARVVYFLKCKMDSDIE